MSLKEQLLFPVVFGHRKHPWPWVRATKCKNWMQVGQLQLHGSHEPTTLLSASQKLDFATPFCSVHVCELHYLIPSQVQYIHHTHE